MGLDDVVPRSCLFWVVTFPSAGRREACGAYETYKEIERVRNIMKLIRCKGVFLKVWE